MLSGVFDTTGDRESLPCEDSVAYLQLALKMFCRCSLFARRSDHPDNQAGTPSPCRERFELKSAVQAIGGTLGMLLWEATEVAA
jgi:hypothetical protein